jgi:hypothetical protein
LQAQRGLPTNGACNGSNSTSGGRLNEAMNRSASSNLNAHVDSNSVFKKVIQIGDQPPTMLVFLKESIVQQLDINEDTFFEQIPTSQGVLLKFSNDTGSFNDATEKTRRRKDGIIGEQEK